MTTYGAISDDKVVKLTTFFFQCVMPTDLRPDDPICNVIQYNSILYAARQSHGKLQYRTHKSRKYLEKSDHEISMAFPDIISK